MPEISEFLIKRKSGEEIKVLYNKEDFDKVSIYKWQYHPRGPIYPLKRGKEYILLHRYLLNTNKRISFLNGNKFDCRKENLVPEIINPLNRRRKEFKIKENGKIVGVYFNHKRKQYQSYVKFNKIQLSKIYSESILKERAKERAIEKRKEFLSLSNEDFIKLFRVNKLLRTNPEDKTFEQCYDEIKKTVYSRKQKWLLEKHSYISFDDVAIEILAHINNKWYLWDQKRDNLKNWLNRIVSNQILNKARNYNNQNGINKGFFTIRQADTKTNINDDGDDYDILGNQSEIIEEKDETPERLQFLNAEIKEKLNAQEYGLYVNKILPIMVKLLENYK